MLTETEMFGSVLCTFLGMFGLNTTNSTVLCTFVFFCLSVLQMFATSSLNSPPCGFELGAAHRTICSVLKKKVTKVQRTEPKDNPYPKTIHEIVFYPLRGIGFNRMNIFTKSLILKILYVYLLRDIFHYSLDFFLSSIILIN